MLNFDLKRRDWKRRDLTHYGSQSPRLPIVLRYFAFPIAALLSLLPMEAMAGNLELHFSREPHHTSRSSIRVYSGSSGHRLQTHGQVQTYGSGHLGGTSIRLRIGDRKFDSFRLHPYDFFGNSRHYNPNHFKSHIFKPGHHYPLRVHRPYHIRRVIVRDRSHEPEHFDDYGFRIYDNRSSKEHFDVHGFRDYGHDD